MKLKNRWIIVCAFIAISFLTNLHAKSTEVEYPGNVKLFYYDEEMTPYYPKPLKKVRVADKILYVIDGAIVPKVHSAFFVEHTTIYAGEDVLDIGTGSGIQGIFAADKARRVVSTDISSKAIENAKINAKFHRVENIIDIRKGSLFEPIKKDEKFDVILFNLDVPLGKKMEERWALHVQFFNEVGEYLKPSGRIYYQHGGVRNIAHIRSMAEKSGYQIMKMNMVAAMKQKQEPFVLLFQRLKPISVKPISKTKNKPENI